MTEQRDGQVVTFYSYKGGTGRTMALANVAWILAANGKRVLTVDWDLESPGLHRFFAPFYEAGAFADAGGVVDLIREFEWATTRAEHRDAGWHERFARVANYAFSLRWDHFPEGGQLDFLAAGRQDRNYLQLLASLNWDNFYQRLGGGQFFDALRRDMKRNYDYTLIDSRTGLSDIADICTIHLPDTLVDCFTLSEQGIDGAARVAEEVQNRYRARNIRILPVPMRVDPAEKLKADTGRDVARYRFGGLPSELSERERDRYWVSMQVPYQAYYAYEEMLATFGDLPGETGTLLAAYEALTGHISHGEVTALPPMDAATRAPVNARFVRLPPKAVEEVILRYVPADELWAEWITHVLETVGVRVIDQADAARDGATGAKRTARMLTVVSRSVTSSETELVAPGEKLSGLAVFVSDGLRPPGPAVTFVRVHGLGAIDATKRLLGLVGRPEADPHAVLAGGPRFPGTEPMTFDALAANPNFTGRESVLRRIRQQLRTSRTGVVLRGLGGVGKTQVAIEYANRYRGAYDVVWWVDAGNPQFIDVRLGDLGRELKLPVQTLTADNTRQVLQALKKADPPYARWLIIFDNAEDVANVAPFIPSGPGHVIITSRSPDWKEKAEELAIDVFVRGESMAHLRQRVPSMPETDADRIAEAVGDLPIAVAGAGAWLAATGDAVDGYLEQIAKQGPGALVTAADSERRVAATWEPALQSLQAGSPGAYRLLQFCSVLAPEVSLDLVYSDEMAAALRDVDPAVSDRLYRASLVQQINKFALLKLDQIVEEGPGGERILGPQRGGREGQIVVHRLVQDMVRGRMTAQEQEAARHRMHLMLAGSRPESEVDDPVSWPRFRMLWPHLEASEATACEDEQVRALLIDRVRYVWMLGGLDVGRKLATDLAARWEARLAEAAADDPTLRTHLLKLMFNQANILRDLGLFEDAMRIDEAGQREQKQLLGPTHPDTLLSAGGLAGDLRGLGRYGAALTLDEQTHKSWVDRFGEDHPRTLTSLSNRAVSHRLLGQFRSALELDQQVYRRRRLVLQENHLKTLESHGNVARDLREGGQFAESIEILRSVVETFNRVWGSDSRGALDQQTNLAVSLRSAGRAYEAGILLDRAYDRLRDREGQGPQRPETLICQLSRAMTLLALDRPEHARAELIAVRDVYERSLGPDHPHTVACQLNLATIERARRDRDEALRHARVAAEAFARVLDPDHPYTIAAETNLAICSAEAGDETTALTVIEAVTPRALRVLGAEHPDALRCRANRVIIARMFGRDVSSEEEAEVQHELTQLLGDTHPAMVSLQRGRLLHRTIDPHPF